MSLLQAEVYEAFRSIDVPDDKALKAAVALSTAMARVEDETARGFSKRDADIEAIRKDVGTIKIDMVAMRGEMTVLKWMGGVLLTMVTAIVFKLFLH